MSRRARALLVLAALVGLVVPGASPAAAAPKQVLVLGDSIVGAASNYIDFYMSGAGDGSVRTTIKAVGGSAICDLFAGNGGPWTINGLLAERRYDAVVMAFSGNSFTRCMQGMASGDQVVAKYRADAAAVMRITQQYGVPRVVWVEPPAARGAGLDYVRTRIGMDVYKVLPASWPTARVIDGGAGLEAYGLWRQFLPCAPWDRAACYAEHVPIAHPDGVHLACPNQRVVYGVFQPCDTYSAGSNRYGMALAATRGFIGL